MTVTVKDVNEAPSVTGPASVTRAENGTRTVASYTASDPDGDEIRWSRGGAQAGYFRLTGSGLTRTLAFVNKPDYETRSSYAVQVIVHDRPAGGLKGSASASVTLTDGPDPGSVSFSDASPEVGQNITAELRDPDGGVKDDSWSWSHAVGAEAKPDATSFRYTVQPEDAGRRLRAAVSYTDAHGPNQSAAAATGTVQAIPPEAPVVTATPGDGYVDLSWTQPRNNGAAIDFYQWKRSGKGWTSVGKARSVRVTGLTNGATYTFYARAHNDRGYSAAGSDRAKPAGVPKPPKDLKGARGVRRITLTWSAADGNGSEILHYEFRRQRIGGSWSGWYEISGGKEAASRIVAGLAHNTWYNFQVRAESEDGEGAAAGRWARTAGKPGAPKSLATARPGRNQAGVSWEAANANGSAITGYQYRRRVGTTGSWTPWYNVAGGGKARGRIVSGLSDNTAYTWEVRARNGVGYGPAASIYQPPLGPGGNVGPEGDNIGDGEGQPGPSAKPAAAAAGPDSLAVTTAPNPFNASITLSLDLPQEGPVTLTVYNTAGQVVARLMRGDVLAPGRHVRQWHGAADTGRPVASGLYLYRLIAGGQVRVGKIALVR